MRLSRIYCTQQLQPALRTGEAIRLDSRCHHYLFHVLRLREGDTLTLFDGSGSDYTADIQIIDRKKTEVTLREVVNGKASLESPLTTCLALGVSKGDRMDYALQKSVELGVNKIQPLITERVNVNRKGDRLEKKREHWLNVMISACEQTGRSVLPLLEPPLTYSLWLTSNKLSSDVDLGIVLKLDGEKLDSIVNNQSQINSATLLVGPEGGLSSTEIQAAEQVGFKGVALGPRVLRTETAPVVALALLQNSLGDF